jgi:probable HAF family extracellular repeat protein
MNRERHFLFIFQGPAMQILVRRTSVWALALALAAAAGCDNRVTEPASRLDPDDAVRAAKPVSNSVTALEPLPGTAQSYSSAQAINDLGQVVGESSTADGGIHAVIWENSTIPRLLGMIAGHAFSSAAAISGDGSIIAGTSREGITNNAVRWLRSNGEYLIDPLQFGADCVVSGISPDGTAISGTCNNTLAVVWLNGSRIVLGQGFANGVNSKRQAVGVNSSFDHALRWDFSTLPVTITDLGNLGGTFAVANDINEAGQVTGWSENANHISHAFLWSPRKGTMVDVAPNDFTSGGYGIDATGKVVGDMFPTFNQHAGYYDGRKIVDLGVLPGYESAIAVSINNNGIAVGSSHNSGLTRATRWVVK